MTGAGGERRGGRARAIKSRTINFRKIKNPAADRTKPVRRQTYSGRRGRVGPSPRVQGLWLGRARPGPLLFRGPRRLGKLSARVVCPHCPRRAAMLLVSSIVYKLSPNARRRNVEAGAGLSNPFSSVANSGRAPLGAKNDGEQRERGSYPVPSEIKGSGIFLPRDNRDNRSLPPVDLLFFSPSEPGLFSGHSSPPPRNLAVVWYRCTVRYRRRRPDAASLVRFPDFARLCHPRADANERLTFRGERGALVAFRLVRLRPFVIRRRRRAHPPAATL